MLNPTEEKINSLSNDMTNLYCHKINDEEVIAVSFFINDGKGLPLVQGWFDVSSKSNKNQFNFEDLVFESSNLDSVLDQMNEYVFLEKKARSKIISEAEDLVEKIGYGD